ncbi:translation elongation factor EF-1 alpha [Hypoxylon texense]
MISASVSGGTVCLRCRLRLLRQSTQPFRGSNRDRILTVRQSSLRCFASESTARFDVDPVSEGGQDKPSGSQNEAPQGRKHQGDKKYELKRINGRKRHLVGGRVLTEDVEGLSTGMLGKPGHVIVMRDHSLYRKKDRLPAPESPDDEPNSQSITDISALLNNQRKTPTAKEVRENIDDLRPKTDTTLPKREFRKLQSLLTDGFLSVQLMAYLEYYKQHGLSRELPQASAEPIQGVDQTPKYDWIKRISPWVPLGDQQSIAGGTDPSLYGYVTDSATAKAKLAVRIMRECWGLSIAELSAGLGETRVRIRISEFLLLMRGTQWWVNGVGKTWLGPDEKIEIFRNQNTLRLVTTKTKAPVLIKSLDETLKQITTKTFPVGMVTSEPIDEAVLEELRRITNAHINRSHTHRRLHVTWIEAEARDTQGSTGLEDTREVVVRLLLTAFRPKLVTSTLSYMGPDHGRNGRFVTDTTSKEKLGWKDRMSQWARYMLPLAVRKDTSELVNISQRLPLLVEPQAEMLSGKASGFDENKEFIPETQFPVHPVKWAHDLRIATEAHFGYLLHANGPKDSPPPLPHLLTAHHPRRFAPVALHPVHFAQFETSDKSALVLPNATIVVHFWPSPAATTIIKKPRSEGGNRTPGVPPASAPVLELRLAVLGGEVGGVESLRAVTQTHVTDVMLPSSPIDLRFTQTQYALLEGAPESLSTWQPIADFLKPARLDLAGGKLEVPPRQRFPIPARLLDDPLVSAPANPQKLVSVLYTFVGFEVHRSVSVPYEGCKLTYTSVDAGLGGRRGAEVSLQPAFGEDGSHVEADMDKFHDSFLATCQKLARTDTLWSNFPSNRKAQPINLNLQ